MDRRVNRHHAGSETGTEVAPSASPAVEQPASTLMQTQHGNQVVLGAVATGDAQDSLILAALALGAMSKDTMAHEALQRPGAALPFLSAPEPSGAAEMGQLAALLGAEAFAPGLSPAPAGTAAATDEGGASLPADRQEAEAWHEESRKKVDRLYRSALAAEPSSGDGAPTRMGLLRNSVEWIEEGTIEMYSLSPTHDSEERAASGKVAYFDRRRAFDDPGARYGPEPSQRGGIKEVFPCAAHMDHNALVFFDARDASENDLANTVIHEVQHFADRGPGGSFRPDQGGKGFQPYTASRAVFHLYQSEFRARVLDPVDGPSFGSPENKPPSQLEFKATRRVEGIIPRKPAVETQTTDIFSEQVYGVLSDMVRDTSIERWVDYDVEGPSKWLANYAYLPHYYVFDATFRNMVDTYADLNGPNGGNLVNSVRIQALAHAIRAHDIADVRWRALALDGVDLAFLGDRERSAPFWQLATKLLLPMEAHWLWSFVESGRGDVEYPYQEVVTAEGDSLSLLCARYLGDTERWPEVHELNAEVLGPDPNVLPVGVKLRMPRA